LLFVTSTSFLGPWMEGFPTAEAFDMQSSATGSALTPSALAGSASGSLVLLVDDYRDCREMYAAYLTLAGFRVLKASNGLEALAIARAAIPDVVLMDLGLPGIDGCETTRLLKRDPVTRGVPVVALTAQSLPGPEVLDEVGFDGVITKPCLPDELATRVARIVRRRSGGIPQ
jgi:CheY-like chemotaxis protein